MCSFVPSETRSFRDLVPNALTNTRCLRTSVTECSATAIAATGISCWQNSGSHPRGPGVAGMSKHHKPHSWPLLQLARIRIQLEAGIVISRETWDWKNKRNKPMRASGGSKQTKKKKNSKQLQMSRSLGFLDCVVRSLPSVSEKQPAKQITWAINQRPTALKQEWMRVLQTGDLLWGQE